MIDLARINHLLDAARARGDRVLVEPDGFPLLEAIGLAVPHHVLVASSAEAARLASPPVPGARAVVKVASSRVLHRSDVGGVAIVENRADAIAGAIARMESRFPPEGRLGFTISEFVPHEASLGHELLLGLRWTDDFGAVVTLAAGGIYAEFLAHHLRSGEDVAIVPVAEVDREAIARRLSRLPFVELLTAGLRGQAPAVSLDAVVDAVQAFAALGRACVPDAIAECEVNPLAVTRDGLVALDVLVRTGQAVAPAAAPRPVRKLARLLTPRDVAVVGVSEAMNPGHIILNNLLREGFPRERIAVVKAGADEIEGCRCVPSLSALPATVDLLVLAIPAAQVPAALVETIEAKRAESVIVIPGGLEEKAGARDRMAPVHAALAAARASDWQGPVINGGNCLGVRSLPGRIDTMFIPPHKMPTRPDRVAPVAFVSQSGAFAVAKAAKLAALNPQVIATVGNQMDLTVGDYLAYLKDDPTLRVFAVYVEGFRPLDGLRFLGAAREIVDSGRTVILYRAGRTAAGASASASHTASIAGDYAVTRELADAAGVLVAETFEDFEELVTAFVALRARPAAGRRLGAVSNAGFECVAIADALGALSLAPLEPTTRARLEAVLQNARIDGVVDVHNPLDLTPMANDATYEAAVRAVLDDEGVDVGVVGCVPLTPALTTLAPSPAHAEDVGRPGSVVCRLVRLHRESPKPFVVVVDGGPLYDAMAARLQASGVATFRSADRALRVLNLFCAARLRSRELRASRPEPVAP